MQQRRKKVPGDPELIAHPQNGLLCGDCVAQGLQTPQVVTPSGVTCKFGHGGAEGVGATPVPDWVNNHEDPDPDDAPSGPAGDKFRQEFRSGLRQGDLADAPELGDRGWRDPEFKVRAGDTLTVKFDGANLQIAPYSSVSLDSAIYSRKLEEGDDPEVEFDRIYAYLKRKLMAVAVTKLSEFADEHRKARERAGTR